MYFFIFKSNDKQYNSKVSAHCSGHKNRKKERKKKARGRNRMQVPMATIYFLNYKGTVAKAWRRLRVYHEQTGACVKEEGGKSWKLSEIEHDFFEKRSLAPLWDYERHTSPLPLPVCFCDISWAPLLALSRPQNFAKKKDRLGIYREICNHETRNFLAISFSALR